MFTEQEVYDIFSLLFTAVFLNFQPEHGWTLKTQAVQVGAIISQVIEKSINEASPNTTSVSIALRSQGYQLIHNACFAESHRSSLQRRIDNVLARGEEALVSIPQQTRSIRSSYQGASRRCYLLDDWIICQLCAMYVCKWRAFPRPTLNSP